MNLTSGADGEAWIKFDASNGAVKQGMGMLDIRAARKAKVPGNLPHISGGRLTYTSSIECVVD